MPTLGTTELVIILIIVLMIFGLGRVPQVGRAIGQGIREFRESIALLRNDKDQPADQEDTRAQGLKS